MKNKFLLLFFTLLLIIILVTLYLIDIPAPSVLVKEKYNLNL